MSKKDLLNYGMAPIGKFYIMDNRFRIKVVKDDAKKLERYIYAFLVGNEIMRVGSSSRPLEKRLHEWELDVTKALNGDFRKTPEGEAKIWQEIFCRHLIGEIYARLGTVVETPVGTFNLFRLEEEELIDRHQPRCCNDINKRRRCR